MDSASGKPSLRSLTRGQAQQQQQDARPATNLTIRHSTLAPEDEANNEFGQGAIAGPSSPSRRRRRPSASRRRSSSITAAASLISSYSTSPQERQSHTGAYNDLAVGDGDVSGKGQDAGRTPQEGEEDDEEEFGGDAIETARDAQKAFRRGRSSPYHMALVSLLFSLAQGMPLASQFKVYSYMMCQLYQKSVDRRHSDGQSTLSIFSSYSYQANTLPPAPELPSDPACDNRWTENATSTYAAAMAMVGALLGLVLLNRCSKYSDYFGRKPLLLVTQVLLAVSMTVFRLSVFLPTYVGVCLLYVSVVVLEASAGAPLKIAIQNYVVDTTNENQRAGALSFTEGFGQIGAFPSSTLGGWLAVVTQEFFSPFYASIAVYAVSTAYVLLFVPESKKHRHRTMIDDFERFGGEHSGGQRSSYRQTPTLRDGNDDDDTTDGDTDGGLATESYFSSMYDAREGRTWWRSFLHRFNFLAPLAVFLPNCQLATTAHKSLGRKWRLFVLAIIVVLEESFQVFLVPVLLLYNTSVFKYDVVQNGYLVSLLQGVRALYLTICFPWLVGKFRSWIKRRQRAKNDSDDDDDDVDGTNANERTPLNGGSTTDIDEQREDRGRLDIAIMLVSYLLCAASFGLLAMTRIWREQYRDGKASLPPWIGIAIGVVGLQVGAGATSLRTALLVNAVSEQADEVEENEHREALQNRLASRYGASSASSRHADRQISAPASASYQGSVENDGASFHVHHERHQSKALAANQILCTAVYALIPLLTSKIFGIGLIIDRPELVWIFKSVMALLSAVATLVLLFSYSSKTHAREP